MTRIVLLAAMVLATLPVRAEAEIFKRADDSRQVHLSNSALPTAGDCRQVGDEAIENKAALNKRLSRDEITSIITNLHRTRSELQAQIESQRRQVLQLEEDIAKIIAYLEGENRPQSTSESSHPVKSPEMHPANDSADSKLKISENNVTDQGKGWIRNERTGDTISLRHGKVTMADRGGKLIDRPAVMLTSTRVHTPDAPLRVGNLDVSFSPRVSKQVKMAFLQYPTTPMTHIQRNELYANIPKDSSSGVSPPPKKEGPVKLEGIGGVRQIRTRHHAVATVDSPMNHQKPTRSMESGDVTEVGTGGQNSRLLTERNRTIPVGNGIQAGIGKGHNGMRPEEATGFNLRRKAAEKEPDVPSKKKVAFLMLQDEYIDPRTSNQRKIEIASMLYSLGG